MNIFGSYIKRMGCHRQTMSFRNSLVCSECIRKMIFWKNIKLLKHIKTQSLALSKIFEHFSQQASYTLDLEHSSQQENCTLNHVQLFVCTEDFSISLSGFELFS